jgi:uncharacterized delta-60 repeat protein
MPGAETVLRLFAQEKLVSLSLRSFGSLRRFATVKRRPSQAAHLAEGPGHRPAVEPLEGRVLLATHLPAVADTFVRRPEYRDVNFGAAPFLWVKTAPPNGGADRIAYLKFNINQLDPAVGNATLYLAGALQTTGPNFAAITAAVWGVPDTSWQEGNGDVVVRRRNGGGPRSQLSGTDIGDGTGVTGGMTWNNQPVNWDNPAASGAVRLAGAIVDRDTFQTYAFDVTGYVQQQKNAGAQFITLAVRNDEPTAHFMRFISRDYGGTGEPQLLVARAGQENDSFVRAKILAPDVGGPGGPSTDVRIEYTSTSPIRVDEIGNNDIIVKHEDGGTALDVINASADPPFDSATVTAGYTIVGPGGSWDPSDNGLYTIELRDKAVRDGQGNETPQILGSFRVAIGDTQRPSATIAPGPGVTAGGGNTYSFDVTYSDNVAVNTATVNVTNVKVFRPNVPGDLTVLSAIPTPDNDAGTVRVTYTVQAPDGSWDAGDNGTYTIRQLNTQVRDTAGLDTGTEFEQQFAVAIVAADNVAPTVQSVSALPVNSAGGTSHTVTVTYDDNVAVDVSSIGPTDIEVRGPGNVLLPVTAADVNTPGNGAPRTATYTVTPPGGSWDAADNGDYAITVKAGEVRDTSGNVIAADTGSFHVEATGTDTQPPSAAIDSAPNVTTAGATEHSVAIRYTDNVAVDVPTTTGANALSVTGPRGEALQLLGAAPVDNGNGSVTVTYRIQALGGIWDATDAGAYTIALNGGVVKDVNGNTSPAATLGTFQVDLAPPDTAPPVAAVSPIPTVVAVTGTYDITVHYTDDVGINLGTLGPDDIVVSGSGQQLAVTGPSISAGSSGTDVTATYHVQGPGGQWDEADEGITFHVTVVGGAVVDGAQHGNAQVSGPDFGVNIGNDQSGPVATLNAANVTTFNAPDHTISVTYTDGGNVKYATIDPSDITVTRTTGGPAVTLVVDSVSVFGSSNQPSLQANYVLKAPGGGWDPTDNGTYTVTLNPNAVTDTKNKPATASGTPWTFNVDVQINDIQAPSATVITAGNITAETGNAQNIVVEYRDDIAVKSATIDLANVVLHGPRGITLQAVSATVTPLGVDDPLLTATYVFNAPGGTWDATENGTWTIEFNQGIGGVQDVTGKPVSGTGSFTVNVPPTNPIDPDFGSPNTGFTVEALATLPDGRIIAVGRRGGPSTGGFQGVIQARGADGNPDATFGNGGQVLVDPVNGADTVFYAVQYANGGIVVAGSMDNNMVITRYGTDGRLDTSFGANGRMFTDFDGAIGEAAYALAVAPDGRFVIGGTTPARGQTAGDVNFAFARFTAGGAPDVTFGGTGKVLYDANGPDVVGALVVQPNGQVVAAGSSGADVVLVRLNIGGDQDLTFGTDGILHVPGLKARLDQAPYLDRTQALGLQGDRILVGNHTADGNFAVVRVRTDSGIDQGFGTGGTATIDLGGDDDVDAIVVQPLTNEILVLGTTSNGPGGSAATAVAALDLNGQLIEGWNNGGKIIFEPDIAPVSTELHIGQLVLKAFGTRDAQGRLVVGSSDLSPTTTSSALKRLLAPGVQVGGTGPAIGSLGLVDGKWKKSFRYEMGDGRILIFSIKGGRQSNAQAFRSGDEIGMLINDGGGVSVSVKVKGGSGRVSFSDIAVNGALRSFTAKTGDLLGTLYVTGQAGKIRLGNVTGGTVAAGREILSLAAGNLADAKVLSGANLASDGKLGGTGTAADTFTPGVVGNVKVSGKIERSIIAAGLNPVDGVFGNEDDAVIGADTSVIKSITARGGADEGTRFVAGSVGAVKLPKKVGADDPRIRTS